MAGIRIPSALVVVLVILAVLGAPRQSGAQTPDVFTATGTIDDDTMNREMPITFVVSHYSTEAERQAATAALRRGAMALHALFKTLPDVGHMEIDRRTIPLKYAYRNPANGGRTIVLVADGPVAVLDPAPEESTNGYDFALASIDFSLPGFAAGELGQAVKLSVNSSGLITAQGYNPHSIKLADIQKQ